MSYVTISWDVSVWRNRSVDEALREILGESDLEPLWRLPGPQIRRLVLSAVHRDPNLLAPSTTFATALHYTDLGKFRQMESELVAELDARARRLSPPLEKDSHADR